MQKLSVDDIVKNNENCYSFVIAIAKRARQISEKSNEEEEILDEKPVQIAVQEFVEGKFRIVQKPKIVEEEILL
jgi:DNA-directed RNA polymerase subunit omega